MESPTGRMRRSEAQDERRIEVRKYCDAPIEAAMIGPPPSLHPSRQNVWAAGTTDCNGWLACLAWEREPVVRNWKPLESIPSPVSSLSLFPLMSWLSLIVWDSYTESWPTSNTTPHHLHPNQTHQVLGLKLASNMRCLRKKMTHFKFVRPSEKLLLAFLKWFMPAAAVGNCHTCLLVKRQGWKIAKQMKKKTHRALP